MTHYTLADLERITGAKRRSLQLWSDAGVIVADPQTMHAGSGTHRLFSQDEAVIACALKAFSAGDRRLPVGSLKTIAAAIRNMMSKPAARRGIEAAIEGDDARCYLVSEQWGEKDWRVHVITGPDDPNSVELYLKAMGAAALHLSEPDSFASVILLNTYTKGLRA